MTEAAIDAADRLLLERAVQLAERGMFSVTANPRVGCVLVNNGELLGSGAHLRAGEGHAEVMALQDARSRNSATAIAGSTAYVSLEPCCHAGRTPACTGALINAGIKRVIVAMLDPHPKVAGEGVAVLRAAGVQVDVVPLDSARRLNYGHSTCQLQQRPYVRIKVAQSLDGRTAMASGESKWITGPAARRDVQYWRARSSAVITGAGTVLADDPALTVRESALATDIAGEPVLRQPLRVIADSKGRSPRASQVFNDGHATLWVNTAAAPAVTSNMSSGENYVEQLVTTQDPASARVSLVQMLAELAGRGCNEVLVEAGGQLVGEFLRQDIWDELLFYTAPRLLGSDARPTADLQLARMAEAVEAKIAAVDVVGADVRSRLVRAERDLAEVDRIPLGYPVDWQAG